MELRFLLDICAVLYQPKTSHLITLKQPKHLRCRNLGKVGFFDITCGIRVDFYRASCTSSGATANPSPSGPLRPRRQCTTPISQCTPSRGCHQQLRRAGHPRREAQALLYRLRTHFRRRRRGLCPSSSSPTPEESRRRLAGIPRTECRRKAKSPGRQSGGRLQCRNLHRSRNRRRIRISPGRSF